MGDFCILCGRQLEDSTCDRCPCMLEEWEESGDIGNCGRCGSNAVEIVGGDNVMHVGRGMRHETHFKCNDCGHWWRQED